MHEPVTNRERSLLDKVAAGEEPAFRDLVNEYSDTVYKYVFRITRSELYAEEVVQDVFMQIWQSREALLKVQNFGGYLHVVSRNYALNVLKKMLRDQHRQIRWENDIIHESDTGDVDHYRFLLEKAVDRLPPQQRTAWILNRRMRKSYAEVAAEMGISKETVKKYLQLATQSVSDFLRQHPEFSIIMAIVLRH